MTRVDEGAKSDPGDQARLADGGVPKQMGNDPLRQIVRLDSVTHSHFSQRRRQSSVTAHRPLDQAVVSQPVKPAALPVTRGDGEQQVQVFWGRRSAGNAAPTPASATRRSTVAITNEPYRLGGGHHLVPDFGSAGKGFRGQHYLGGTGHLSLTDVLDSDSTGTDKEFLPEYGAMGTLRPAMNFAERREGSQFRYDWAELTVGTTVGWAGSACRMLLRWRRQRIGTRAGQRRRGRVLRLPW